MSSACLTVDRLASQLGRRGHKSDPKPDSNLRTKPEPDPETGLSTRSPYARTWSRDPAGQRPDLVHGRDARAEHLGPIPQQAPVVRIRRVAVPEVLVRRHVSAGEVDVQAAQPADKPAQAEQPMVVRSQVAAAQRSAR